MLEIIQPAAAVHISNASLVSAEKPSITGAPPTEMDLGYLASIGLKNNLKAWRQAWQDGQRL